MTIAAGTEIGPFRIVSLLGAGGVGEVYRARDTQLDRDVALKVLPDAFADDGGTEEVTVPSAESAEVN